MGKVLDKIKSGLNNIVSKVKSVAKNIVSNSENIIPAITQIGTGVGLVMAGDVAGATGIVAGVGKLFTGSNKEVKEVKAETEKATVATSVNGVLSSSAITQLLRNTILN